MTDRKHLKPWLDPAFGTIDERLRAMADDMRGDNDPLPPDVAMAKLRAIAEESRRRRGVSIDDPDYEANLNAEIARIASRKPENS